MKDEEMALEYSLKINGFTKEDCYDENGELRQFIKSDMNIFLAGLKAGRPEWHKVADELPTSDKDKYYFVVDKLNVYMIARFYEGKWSNYAVIEDVIAWCEIPIFEKE